MITKCIIRTFQSHIIIIIIIGIENENAPSRRCLPQTLPPIHEDVTIFHILINTQHSGTENSLMVQSTGTCAMHSTANSMMEKKQKPAGTSHSQPQSTERKTADEKSKCM